MKRAVPEAPLQLLSVVDIAAWQIPSISSKSQGLTAKLPALQRGAVWKPRQVELLWDSLLNGFPIGSFLLTPYVADRKNQRFLHESFHSAPEDEADYHLLDGQQRCNAISLGFLNSWDHFGASTAALWLDLNAEGVNDERTFIFRVVTRSHPWGYQRTDSSKTLEYAKRRKALQAYTKVYKVLFPDADGAPLFGNNSIIRYAWPWDAICPIPFPFVVESLMKSSGNVWIEVGRLMEERLPYWDLFKDSQYEQAAWREHFDTLIKQPNATMEKVVRVVGKMIGRDGAPQIQIPALVLPHLMTGDPGASADDKTNPGSFVSTQDPVETLFIRVNSAGTPLQGEELNYSILKSIWPGAQDVVEALSTGLMVPSRLVALVSRLVVAKAAFGDKRPPAPLDVSRFRRLIHGKDSQCPRFRYLIEECLSNAKALLDLAQNLLTLRDLACHKYRLPASLVADLARSAPEIFFIYLLWLDRLLECGKDPLQFEEPVQRRVIGALTALAWFGKEQSLCSSILWARLQSYDGEMLPEFFSLGALKKCLEIGENGKLPLVPLLPPPLLEESVQKASHGLGHGSNQTWSSWRWWDNFSGVLPKSDAVKKWYGGKLKGDEDVEYQREAWTYFVDVLWGKREILIYAQREWLLRWFPSFDPTSSDHLEDTDRPWDFDHIHPQKYIYGRWNIPQVVKDWHGSIGNLRAWPFELNRSDGESVPREKLRDPGEGATIFGFDAKGERLHKQVLKASFVSKDCSQLWDEATPDEGWFPVNYLAKPDDFGACRVTLVKAITTRWLSIYMEWYKQLLVGDLFK